MSGKSAVQMHNLQTIINLIQDGQNIIEKFPDLRPVPYQQIDFNKLVETNIYAKEQLLDEIKILGSATQNIKRRIDLPVLIGLMGKYSSGKSSLLNAFFSDIFDGNIPPDLVRATGNTATDTNFTYITHSDFVGKFNTTNNINLISSSNEIFRSINFIDTPGTGWAAFTNKEVSDLLSSADLILFVFKPTEILEAESLKALQIKFANYESIPIWYVITFAAQYAEFGDWSSIDRQKFKTDLSSATSKLQKRPPADNEDAEAMDIVLKNISFSVNENTFLVDARDKIYTKELLDRILEKFGSQKAITEKGNQIELSISEIVRNLSDLLVQAEHHISELSVHLKIAYVQYIQTHSEDFRANRIYSAIEKMSARMSTSLGPQLRSIQTDTIIHYDIPITFGYAPPEVSILQNRLSKMEREKLSPIFRYTDKNILFDTDNFLSKIMNLEHEATTKLSDILDSEWKTALLDRDLWQRGSLLDKFSPVNNFFQNKSAKIVQFAEESSMRKLTIVLGYFESDVLSLSERYAAPDLTNTIFKRQNNLLKNMKNNIPDSISSTEDEMERAIEIKRKVLSENFDDVNNLVKETTSDLTRDTSLYLERNVFSPAQQAMEFLMGDTSYSEIQRSESPNIINEFAYEMPKDAYLRDIENLFVDIENEYTSNSKETISSWQMESGSLEKDFGLLVTSAKDVRLNLEGEEKDVVENINKIQKSGVQVVNEGLNSLKKSINEITDSYKDIIQKALAEAKHTQRTTQIINVIVLILGLALVGVDLYASLVAAQQNPIQFSPRWITSIAIFSAGFLFLIWIGARILSNRSKLKHNQQLIFEARKRDFLIAIGSSYMECRQEIGNELQKQNDAATHLLSSRHANIIRICREANNDIIPRLDEQIQSAARLATKTTLTINNQRKDSYDRINGIVRHVESLFSEVEIDVRTSFIKTVNRITQIYIQKLDEYINNYQRHANDVVEIRNNLSKVLPDSNK